MPGGKGLTHRQRLQSSLQLLTIILHALVTASGLLMSFAKDLLY